MGQCDFSIFGLGKDSGLPTRKTAFRNWENGEQCNFSVRLRDIWMYFNTLVQGWHWTNYKPEPNVAKSQNRGRTGQTFMK